MSLSPHREFTIETKWYLSSYRAASDVTFAIAQYPSEEMAFSRWQIYWASICALLKTSIVLMQVDARRCYPGRLKESLAEAWRRLGKEKDAYPLSWGFVDRERNNILKEYEFSAYAAYLKGDGAVEDFPTFLGMVGSKQVLKINKGRYAGRDALELAGEASAWTKGYIEDAIRAAGLDPDEKVSSDNFLRRQQGLPIVAPPDEPPVPSGLATLLSGGSKEAQPAENTENQRGPNYDKDVS